MIVSILLGVAFSQQTPDFDSLLASAQQAQARGDFKAAAESYRRAVALHPEIAELRANLGLMYYQIGKDQEAISAFLQAIRLKPGLFVPNLFLGLDYVKLKRFDDAIPFLKRATSSSPSDMQAALALAQAYIATGKTQLAIPLYLHVVQLDPEKANGWFHLGVAYLEQLEADASRLMARHKDSGYLYALTAETFAEQKAFPESAKAYKETLACRSYPTDTHAGFGIVLLNQQDFPGAQRELNAELASNPGSLLAKLGFARLHIQKDEIPESTQEIAAIWKADPNFLRTHAWLLKELPQDRLSDLQSALEKEESKNEIFGRLDDFLFRNTVGPQTTGSSPLANAAMDQSQSNGTRDRTAAELYASGRYRECSDWLASRVPRLHAPDLRLLAYCSFLTAKYQIAFGAAQRLTLGPATESEGLYWETKSAEKLATQALARASELDPNSAIFHVLLGDIHRQRKRYGDAKSEYQKALVIRPEDTGAVFGLCLSLLGDSDTEGALRVAEAAVQKKPDDPELNVVLGEILSARYRFSEAEPYLKKALKAKPDLIPHVHALLGRVYAETNHTQEAIAELKLGLADDKDGHLHYQLARLYQKIGDRVSAQKALEESVRIQRESLSTPIIAMQQNQTDAATQ